MLHISAHSRKQQFPSRCSCSVSFSAPTPLRPACHGQYVSNENVYETPIFGPRILPAHLTRRRRAWRRTRARSPSRHAYTMRSYFSHILCCHAGACGPTIASEKVFGTGTSHDCLPCTSAGVPSGKEAEGAECAT